MASLTSFDPLGDGTENEGRVRYAKDGSTKTAWLTNCYQNQYFGAKQGVGVVVKLSGPARGELTINFVSAPWNLDVYVADECFMTGTAAHVTAVVDVDRRPIGSGGSGGTFGGSAG